MLQIQLPAIEGSSFNNYWVTHKQDTSTVSDSLYYSTAAQHYRSTLLHSCECDSQQIFIYMNKKWTHNQHAC